MSEQKAGKNSPRRLPTLLEMTAALTGSVDEWRKQGFAVASDEEHARRKSICEGCEMWKPKAFGGVGRCLACGCAGFKLWLDTSKCPLGKWEGQIVATTTPPKPSNQIWTT